MELENVCTLEDLNEFLYRKRVLEKSVNIVYSMKRQGLALDITVAISSLRSKISAKKGRMKLYARADKPSTMDELKKE